jgi:hypothetical protein
MLACLVTQIVKGSRRLLTAPLAKELESIKAELVKAKNEANVRVKARVKEELTRLDAQIKAQRLAPKTDNERLGVVQRLLHEAAAVGIATRHPEGSSDYANAQADIAERRRALEDLLIDVDVIAAQQHSCDSILADLKVPDAYVTFSEALDALVENQKDLNKLDFSDPHWLWAQRLWFARNGALEAIDDVGEALRAVAYGRAKLAEHDWVRVCDIRPDPKAACKVTFDYTLIELGAHAEGTAPNRQFLAVNEIDEAFARKGDTGELNRPWSGF